MTIYNMKHVFLLICCLTSLIAFGQKDTDYFFGRKKTVKAEILMENGTTKTGFLKSFPILKRNFALQSLEKNLDSKEFEFIASNSNNSEKIKISDIKTITTLNDDNSESIRYDKMKLKTINSKYEIVDLNKTVLLPLEQEGKLNLYGFYMIFFTDSLPYDNINVYNKYATTLFMPYLKNSDSEYAYLPFDLNRVNIFNLGKMEGKFKIALQEATKSCPEFQSNIDELMKAFEKSNKANMKKQYFDKEAQKKQVRKDIKDKDVELMLQIKLDSDYMIKPYLDLVNAYNMKCKQ